MTPPIAQPQPPGPSATPGRIIDYWVNLFTPEALRANYLENPEFAPVVRWWGMEDRFSGHSIDEFVALMDASGVRLACLPLTTVASFQTRDMVWDMRPADVAPMLERHPDRFFSLAPIDLRKRMGGVRELETLVRDHGFKGATLHPYGWNLPLNDRAFYPFYAKCAELGVPVVIQTGHSAEMFPSAMGRPILVDDVALYFPELRLVCSHTGWPWTEELIAMAWKHPNVFIGTCTHAPRYWDRALVDFIATRGRGKVLFGTGFPVLTFERALREIEGLGLAPEAREHLLWRTAERVFGLAGR